VEEFASKRNEGLLADINEKWRLVTALGSSFCWHLNDPNGDASPNFSTCGEV
jgi:hypothetical protein